MDNEKKLNDEALEDVTGGTGLFIREITEPTERKEAYTCKSCRYDWGQTGIPTKCPKCGSTNIHMIIRA